MSSLKIDINYAYSQALDWKERYLTLYGGGGSGKSFAAAQKLVIRCLQGSGERILYTRKVGRTLRNSCFTLIRDVISTMGVPNVLVNKTEMSFTFPNGSELISSGLDDVEKLKSIHGVTSIWIEEATELTRQDFTQLDLRLRGETPSYKQILLTYNPVDIDHWLKTDHHDKPSDNHLILKTTFRDNAFIDSDYKRVLEDLQDANYKRIYADGEWGVNDEGIIYTHYKVADLTGNAEETIYGLDFGYNNPTAFVRIDISDGANYVTEELYQSHITNQDLINIVKPIVGRATVYCDSAEPQRIDELKKAGIRAKPAKKDVALGIDHVKRHPLYISPDSTNLINEIKAYKWREAKDKEPLKFKDHLMDAMRYAIFTHKRGGAFTVFG
jgi:phage terminase large subunit